MEQEQTPQSSADESRQTYLRNYETLHAILSGGRHSAGAQDASDSDLSIRLSRILLDNATNQPVPFDGDTGIEALLERLGDNWPNLSKHYHNRRLMGLSGAIEERDESLPASVSLDAGGQLVWSVGPTSSVACLQAALERFDRAVHVAAYEMGCDYSLLAEGYNPYVTSPLDVQLIPRTRWTLLNAHFGKTGRYARDMMRCSCSTQVSLLYGTERDAIGTYRLATALSPLLTFLTDNVRSFRGSGARRCPRMVRSLIWDEIDPERCGVVPGTYDRNMSFDHYIEWLMGIQPIFFVDAMGMTTSTGKRTIRELLSDRVLSANEALGLFDTALPYVRLGKSLELLQADALRPRMAAGYAAFIKGVFGTAFSRDQAWSLLRVNDDQDVELAAHELRMHGWDARIYDRNVSDLVESLLRIARGTLADPEERRILDQIAEQWDVRMVPRDAFVAQEIKAERGW